MMLGMADRLGEIEELILKGHYKEALEILSGLEKDATDELHKISDLGRQISEFHESLGRAHYAMNNHTSSNVMIESVEDALKRLKKSILLYKELKEIMKLAEK